MATGNNNTTDSTLKIVSMNLHGFNQGISTVIDLANTISPDVFFLLQEHWLTPANLDLFDKTVIGYFKFGSSAMSSAVESNILKGRPFGGVMILVKNSLKYHSETIYCSDRFALVRVANWIFVDLYLPCVGTQDRLLICEDVLNDMWSWCERFPSCKTLLCGDFNADLNESDPVCRLINLFMVSHNFCRCDELFGGPRKYTYVSESLGHKSIIDYMCSSSQGDIMSFDVLDDCISFSDHFPLMTICKCVLAKKTSSRAQIPTTNSHIHSLRWDKGDIGSYYQYTGINLRSLLERVNANNDNDSGNYDTVHSFIDTAFEEVTTVLCTGANLFIPRRAKRFYKFWWDQELNQLKDDAKTANDVWKNAGKPRAGPIFSKRVTTRLAYRKRIREKQSFEAEHYSNELHDALLLKKGPAFWKCWNAKFQSSTQCCQVDGVLDNDIVADRFAKHFGEIYTCHNQSRADALLSEYNTMKAMYKGEPLLQEYCIDTELVGNVITKLKLGKAAGLDKLSSEHLKFCHPILSCILAKLFNLMLMFGYVPACFTRSYIVPLPKCADTCSKALTTNDFRGIAITSVLSKTYELCLLERFRYFLTTTDNQFGFKKGSGCSHAIFTVRKIVEKFVNGGSTVNLCALDLSKAFDRTNHHALFIKLMKRNTPCSLLFLLEYWLNKNVSCVKWFNCYSSFFEIKFGLRQGSVLSPYLFAVFIDDIVHSAKSNRCGVNTAIVVYADDILLISPSVCGLQCLLNRCELELRWLDMELNIKKSCCMRIGPSHDLKCCNIVTSNGSSLPWVDTVRYLGIYIISSRSFKISLRFAKLSFFRSVNAIFGKLLRTASEEVIVHLINTKCLPILLYGLEACPLSNSEKKSLDFPMTRLLMKLFRSGNIEVIRTCQEYFGVRPPSELLSDRTSKFMLKIVEAKSAFVCLYN